MSIPTSPNAIPDSLSVRYPSLATLQAAHNGLLKRQRQEGDAPAFLAEVAAFLSEGAATGALLDADADRRTAQGLLDYWVARLYRVGAEPPDATLAEFDPALAPDLPDELCPYLGLDAFREADGDKFFGRADLIAQLVERLANQRLLAVVGRSGSGKSSLVRAGLIPALKRGALRGSEDWRYLPPIVPGSDPMASLARVLRTENQEPRTEIDTSVLSSPVLGSPVVLVVDQFEELFTLCDDDQARQAFVAALREFIETPDAEHRLILTMRSDFEDSIQLAPDLQARFNQSRVQMMPLTTAELRESIEQPAEAVGLKFQAEIVDALLQDILGEPAGLPLLQFTLLKLWEQRDHNRVTREIYERVGGGRLALARSADEFYSDLIPEDKVTAQRILLRMIRPGEGLEITSSRIRREELYHSGEDPGRIDSVLAKLTAAHLLRLTEGETPEDTQIEVAHEALVRNWPTLVDWLEQEKAALTTRQRLEGRADEWVRLGQGSGGLLDEVELREAERWLESAEAQYLGYKPVLPTFVRTSKTAIERRGRRVARLRFALVVVSLAAAVLGIGLAIFAFQQREAALNNEHRATQNAEVAQQNANAAASAQVNAEREAELARAAELQAQTQSVNAQNAARREITARSSAELLLHAGESLFALANGSTDLSQLLARASVPTDTQSYSPFVLYALRRAFEATVRSNTLTGHTDKVLTAAWSPDGRRVLTGSADKTVRLWDITTRKPVQTLVDPSTGTTHTGEVRAVAWSPDGKLILTGSADKTARIWNGATGHLISTLTGHSGIVWAVGWSPDGQQILTGSADRTARLWNASTGTMIQTLGHTGEVRAVAWSPDGRQILTGNTDKIARIWDVATGKLVRPLTGHRTWVTAVAWSPDGRQVLTGSGDQTVRIWDATTGQLVQTLMGHTGDVLTVAWSPDGRQVLTGSSDQTARIWDAITGQFVQTLKGHAEGIWAVAWSPDGRQVLTGSGDQTARIWDVAVGAPVRVLTGHTRDIWAVAWSPDGQQVLTGSGDQTARIWDAATGHLIQTLKEGSADIWAVAWSPDGQRVITGSADGTARVWNVATSESIQLPLNHAGAIREVAWSPDGQRVVTGSADGTARVWNVLTNSQIQVLVGHSGDVWAVAWSPDGQLIITGGADQTARIWDATTGQTIRTLQGHTGDVWAVAWSSDGKKVLTGSSDRTARIWDVTDWQPKQILIGHTGGIWSVSLSPDGKYILTSSSDRTARLWDSATGTLMQTLEGHTGEVWSAVWSPDSQQVLTGSFDGTARLWITNTKLIIAELTRRVCNLFSDDQIQEKISAWRGCKVELAAIDGDLKEYDTLQDGK